MTSAAPRPARVARLARLLPGALRSRAERLPGALAPPVEPGRATPRVAIIGSGFGGLGMAIRLRQAGIDTFAIFEKAESVGGTWRDNTYPGAACDVPSHLYSLSFAPKTDWTRKFPGQAEILSHFDTMVDDFDLAPFLRLGTEVASLTFDDQTNEWAVATTDGDEDRYDVVVSATGQLNRPHVPPIDGLETFDGVAFHSARWDHDRDLTGRSVGVVGIGASAIQFVPPIAEQAGSLTLFQRSVNYVVPKPDAPIAERTRRLFEKVPAARRLYRFSIWARFEARWLMFVDQGGRISGALERAFAKGVGQIESERLPHAALVPDYPVGCKRILISNDWFPALLRPNVEVVTDSIERIEADAVVAGGRRYQLDTLIFGTGFKSTGFMAPIAVTGRGGRDLIEAWSDGAHAHLGLTVPGFPNLFLLYGPNTNLGHNSIIFMLERQISYALSCIRTLVGRPGRALDVREPVEAASNERVQRELGRTVWAASCHSWYKTATGRITNNWSGPTVRYWARTARPRWSDFERLEAHRPR